MVVDPGDDLELLAGGQKHLAMTSSCDSSIGLERSIADSRPCAGAIVSARLGCFERAPDRWWRAMGPLDPGSLEEVHERARSPAGMDSSQLADLGLEVGRGRVRT